MPLRTRLRFATLSYVPPKVAPASGRLFGFSASLLLGLNRNQFHFKNQSLVRADRAAGSARAVGKIGWNVQLPLRPDGHQLQRFGPTRDHAAHGKFGWLAPLVGAVEFRSVDESALIVAHDRVGLGGLRARAGGDNLVLQSARGCPHAIL